MAKKSTKKVEQGRDDHGHFTGTECTHDRKDGVDALQDALTPEPKTVTVNTSEGRKLNVRAAPDIESAVIGELEFSEVVEVLSEPVEGWYRIETGFIKAEFTV